MVWTREEVIGFKGSAIRNCYGVELAMSEHKDYRLSSFLVLKGINSHYFKICRYAKQISIMPLSTFPLFRGIHY